jgi:hypothetical protein
MQSVLLKQRRGIDVSAKITRENSEDQAAEKLIAASRERWRRSHLATVAGQEAAGEVPDPDACPRLLGESAPCGKKRGKGLNDLWASAIDFPLAKSDRRWLAQLTDGEWGRLHASVRRFLDATHYWQDRKGHGCNAGFPSDGELDTYTPAPHSNDEHMLGWCRVVLLTEDYFLPAMAGEFGVVCGDQTIPKFTVLTRYVGAIYSSLAFDHLYRGTNEESKRDNYSVNLFVGREDSDPEPAELVLDGLYRGLGSCCNDYRHSIEAGADDVNDVRMHNLQLTQVDVCGEPMVLVVAKQDIPPHTHMLLDYGDLFWSRFREDRDRELLAASHHDALVRLATGPMSDKIP